MCVLCCIVQFMLEIWGVTEAKVHDSRAGEQLEENKKPKIVEDPCEEEAKSKQNYSTVRRTHWRPSQEKVMAMITYNSSALIPFLSRYCVKSFRSQLGLNRESSSLEGIRGPRHTCLSFLFSPRFTPHEISPETPLIIGRELRYRSLPCLAVIVSHFYLYAMCVPQFPPPPPHPASLIVAIGARP